MPVSLFRECKFMYPRLKCAFMHYTQVANSMWSLMTDPLNHDIIENAKFDPVKTPVRIYAYSRPMSIAATFYFIFYSEHILHWCGIVLFLHAVFHVKKTCFSQNKQ